MPRKRPSFEQETLRLSADRADEVRRGGDPVAPTGTLLVYHLDGVRAVPLRDGDVVTIGRSEPSDVCIDDRSLSRRHARFRWSADVLTVEDLGSTNGTRVGEARVDGPQTIEVGETVYLGTVVVTSVPGPASERPVAGLQGHDGFREALEDELVRARFFGDEVALFMVKAADGEHVAHWSAGLDTRPVDRRGVFSDVVVELLLPRIGAAEALTRAKALAGAEGALLVGAATYPRTASSGDELIDAARTALRRARPAEPVVMAPSLARVEVSASDETDEAPIAISPAMREIFGLVDRVASSPIAVLLTGETGCGKEVIARRIHERGPRRGGPMICVNCGAIPSQLVESTLFGHVKGAFTGASQSSAGVFGSADRGTVLLDEIGELPAAAQAALLRVLETKRVTPVGSSTEREVDVRVLAATHRDLEAMCEAGQFRQDLFYRLNAMVLPIPPLRERREEIAPLAARFFAEASAVDGRDLEGIAPETLRLLRAYDWPGNLRELKNAIDRAVVIAREDLILPEDLPLAVRGAKAEGREALDTLVETQADLKTQVKRHEAQLIEAALEASGGNQTEAAKRLKVPLRTLVHKIKTLGIGR